MQATPIDRPRFRQDLVAEPIEDGGTRFVDVMDPDSGTLFRFYEVEFSLACGMDGQRDVAGLVKWAEEELGLKATPNEVSHVIATLGELGYLERGATAVASANAAAAAAATPPAASDIVVEKGVVVGQTKPTTPAPEIELGKPGTPATPSGELPRAPDLELGAPGATAAARPAEPAVEDIPLGKPGRPDNVEVDLAAEMPVSAAAVKEAVRQSQVMKAVDVPPELAAELDKPAAPAEAKPEPKPADKPVDKPVETKPVETKPEPKPADQPVEAKPVETKPEPKPADQPAEAKPVETKPEPKPADKPAKPAEVRPATHPPAPSRSGVSPVLVAALVLVLLGAGGFAVWKFVLNKPKEAPPATTEQTEPTPPPPPEEPPPPPPETAKLALEQPAAEELKPVAAGRIATIVANDATVKEGDTIARLLGFKPAEIALAAAEKAVAKAKTTVAAAEKERDAAQTAGNPNALAAAEKKLAAAQTALSEQEAKLATAQAALDKFLIKAPAAGKVTAVAKRNAKVTPTDVIATLTRDPVLVATFQAGGEVSVGAGVLLGLHGTDQKLSCIVAATGGDGVKVACPKDAASEGAEVTFAGLDPNAPPPNPAAVPPPPVPASGAQDAPPSDDPPAVEPPPAEPEEQKAEETKVEKRPRPRPRPRQPADESDESAPSSDTPSSSDGNGAGGSDTPAEPPAE